MKRLIFLLGGIAAIGWVVGFIAFVGDIRGLTEPAIGPDLGTTDVIVVLTGGSDRVTAGLSLLTAGKGKKLFISGVHPGSTLEQLLGTQPVAKDLRNCCIALGHVASSTFGNAEETRAWIAEGNDHSLRLVTANYHMPRSLLIFRAALPDMKIIPYPVTPESVKLDAWWAHPGTASLLVTEYMKYLGTLAKQGLGA